MGNAVLSGSERKIQVGENYATHLEHLPAVTYAAFGHIHKPQKLPGSVVDGCYAGSPIQLDFGELGEAKRIVLVEAQPGHPPEIQSLPLSGGRQLWRFEGTMEELAKVAPDVGRVLALLTIHSPSTIADLRVRVQDLLPEAVILDVYPVAADRQLSVTVATAPSGPEPGIEELFRDYLAEQGTRGAAADRVMATFSKLLEAIDTEQEPVFPEEAAISGTPHAGMTPAVESGRASGARDGRGPSGGRRPHRHLPHVRHHVHHARPARASAIAMPVLPGGPEMRPLTLRMSGLRSYRSEVTIDFGDPGLIAIVGDTGAGKSSILEALFFVLYGGCTWDHRATAPLISDGASLMQVELVFLAEGRRWRVFRSASRTSTQNRHQLECLDDPALRFDNDGPVTAEIKRLIGLDQNAFLRTVILPQGQFQMLLQATRTERTAILKGIFRLDQLAEAREQADRTARRLRPGVDSLKLERAALLPDPEAALADARERHEQAESRLTELQSLSETITAAARRRDDAATQTRDIQNGVAQVRDTMMPDADAELARLSDMASQLEDRRRRLETDREQRRSDADSLAEILTRADEQGEGIEALASAASTLQSLAEQLPSLHEEEASCEREGAELKELSTAIASGQGEAEVLEARASAAGAEAARLADLAVAAHEVLTGARSRLDTARRLAEACAERQREAREADERKSGPRRPSSPLPRVPAPPQTS